jgi:hypothetical protein
MAVADWRWVSGPRAQRDVHARRGPGRVLQVAERAAGGGLRGERNSSRVFDVKN